MPKSIAVLSPRFPIRFKVKVSKRITLGEHQLRGCLSYQPIRSDGGFGPQQLDIVIPITVVDRHTVVYNNPVYTQNSGSNSSANRDRLVMIRLFPILLPFAILAGLLGINC